MEVDSVYLSYKSELEQKVGEEKKWLDVLIQTDEQYQDYIFNFLIDSRRLSPIMDYRESRLALQDITYDQFERSYLMSKRKSLEDLFLHPVKQSDIAFFEDEVEENNTSLHILYENHVSEPTYRMMRLLL